MALSLDNRSYSPYDLPGSKAFEHSKKAVFSFDLLVTNYFSSRNKPTFSFSFLHLEMVLAAQDNSQKTKARTIVRHLNAIWKCPERIPPQALLKWFWEQGLSSNLFLIRFRQMLKIPVKIKFHHLYPKAGSKSREATHKPVTTACNETQRKELLLWIAEDTFLNYWWGCSTPKVPTLKRCDVTNNHVLEFKVQCLDTLSPLLSNCCLVAFFHFFGATGWCSVLTDL